jgi:uncharacterized membrane-anchored protein YhcB (DUF1043 family)
MDTTILALIAILLVGGGLLIGLAVGRGSNKLQRRCQALEAELQAARAEQTRYREQVGEHFDQTGELLRTFTRQYRAVYEHMAEGARSLCPEHVTALTASAPEALLEAGAQEAEASPRTGGNGAAGPSRSH